MSDKNIFSITGDEIGNIWVNNALTLPHTLPGMRTLEIEDIEAGPGGWSDALKLSGVRRLTVKIDLIDATFCREDAIDINRCEDVEVLVGDLWAARKYCATIKGGSKRIGIHVHAQHGHGGETDYDIGNFSDQGNEPTTGVKLKVATIDGSPVRVRVLTGDKPVTLNADQRYEIKASGIMRRWFYPVYNFIKDMLRRVGVKI